MSQQCQNMIGMYGNSVQWKKGSIVVKSRDPQKAHLGPLPNVHT